MKRVLLGLVMWAASVTLAGAQLTIAPPLIPSWLDNSGLVADGFGFCVYRAGTSTLATTYTTSTGTANSNPILFDSAGRASVSGSNPETGIWLTPGTSYKFVYVDFSATVGAASCVGAPNGTTIWTLDNVSAVPLASGTVDVDTATAGESIAAGDAVYLSSGAGGTNAGQWYRADADSLSTSTNAVIVGMAPSAIASGATGSVRIAGTITVTGPLTAGSPYYLSGTVGAITATPPTNAYRLGQALSTTSLVIGAIKTPMGPDHAPCGRLTLTSGLPVTIADVTAATTLYYTPYNGCNNLSLFDGTAWQQANFTQVSIAVPAVASQMYDVFGYDNAGTFTLELTAWTNDTTRATALTTQNGVYVKTGALTRLYLGSFRTTTAAGQTEDSATKRFVWNYYNRVPRFLLQQETTANWTYTTATWRQQRATATNQVELVTGVAESPLTLTTRVVASNDTGTAVLNIAIGEDSTTTPVSAQAVGSQGVNAAMANMGFTVSANLWKIPAVGYHKYCTLEASTAVGTTTWLGASSTTAANANADGTGMFGIIQS